VVITDQVVTPEMARTMHAKAVQAGALVGWVVSAGEDEHQGKLVARMVTGSPSVYVLVADTLDKLRAMLPPDLERSERQPADPPGVIELWW
jgi:precorrin-4 methylase